jgi:SAM-dependent methyltransferase
MAARTPSRFAVPDAHTGRRAAWLLFEQGRRLEAFDLCEQLVDDFPGEAIGTLAAAYDLYQRMPSDSSRYDLYVSRSYDFGIREGDKVLDIGSGHLPFHFATHLADVALEDHQVGRAGIPFKRLHGKPVYECSVESMPFRDQEFEFVYCSHVLEHVSDPEKACRELARVARRGYVETPSGAKDLWLHAAKASNHRWAVSRRAGTLVFDEYGPEDVDGLGSDVLMAMHCSPRTRREKAFSALVYLKASVVNVMLYWERELRCEVHRRPRRDAPTGDRPPPLPLPAEARPSAGPLAPVARSARRLLERVRDRL